MITHTRFNPTVNGPLHLGHLYMALVNQHEAHAMGGKFFVRFDDDQDYWLQKLGKDAITRLREEMQEDLKPYLEVDAWSSQAKDSPGRAWVPIDGREKYNGLILPPKPMAMMGQPWSGAAGKGPFEYTDVPEWVPDRSLDMYPYAARLTMSKVILDMAIGVNWLIRGEDLVSEFGLYAFFRNHLGLSTIRQTYLPRLMVDKGRQISGISKTAGGWTIREMTREWGAAGVMRFLRASCLMDQRGPWSVSNVKEKPVLATVGD